MIFKLLEPEPVPKSSKVDDSDDVEDEAVSTGHSARQSRRIRNNVTAEIDLGKRSDRTTSNRNVSAIENNL